MSFRPYWAPAWVYVDTAPASCRLHHDEARAEHHEECKDALHPLGFDDPGPAEEVPGGTLNAWSGFGGGVGDVSHGDAFEGFVRWDVRG